MSHIHSRLSPNTDDINIKIVHPHIGAEIRGIDLTSNLNDETVTFIQRALSDHSVVIFRDQELDDQQQITFSRYFGELEKNSIKKAASNPYVYQISNIDNRGNVISPDSQKRALLETNKRWHIDSSFKPIPSYASVLSCRQIPQHETIYTEYVSLRKAYTLLSPDYKKKLQGLSAVHDYTYSLGFKNNIGVSQQELDALPSAKHPLLHIHQPSGEPSLFISGHINRVNGLSKQDSQHLIQDLISISCRPESVYTHEWKLNDVVMWDNRCVLHRVKNIAEKEVRRAHRTTIAGETKLVMLDT